MNTMRSALEDGYDTDSADDADDVNDDVIDEDGDDEDGEDTETDQTDDDDQSGDTDTDTDDSDDDDEDDEDEAEDKDDESEGLSKSANKKVQARIDKIVAKSHSEKEALESQVESLSKKRDDEMLAGAVQLGIHPSLLSDTELKTVRGYDFLLSEKAFFRGIVTSGEDHQASNKGGDTKDYTLAQAQAELEDVRDRLDEDHSTTKAFLKTKREKMMEYIRVGRSVVETGKVPRKAGSKSVAKKKGKGRKPSGVPSGNNTRSRKVGSRSRSEQSGFLDPGKMRKKGVTRDTLANAYEATL